MCIGIPMLVLEVTRGGAIAERRGRREALNTMLVDDVACGDWVLAYQGSALRKLSVEEAAQTDTAVAALEAALAGEQNLDAYFADLVDREPSLPDHLKETAS